MVLSSFHVRNVTLFMSGKVSKMPQILQQTNTLHLVVRKNKVGEDIEKYSLFNKILMDSLTKPSTLTSFGRGSVHSSAV